jgi:hypothetical protein
MPTLTGFTLAGGVKIGDQIVTTVTGEAFEGSNVVMTAPVGTTFVGVQFASYGTPTGTSGSYAIGPCHAANSIEVVSTYLLGQSGTINVPATNAVFGDPCVGIGKRLYIQAVAA